MQPKKAELTKISKNNIIKIAKSLNYKSVTE